MYNERVTRLEAVVGSLVGRVEKLSVNFERLDTVMVTLAESGVQADQRIDQLGQRVDQLVKAILRQQPNGG
jgi:hypothetical protein